MFTITLGNMKLPYEMLCKNIFCGLFLFGRKEQRLGEWFSQFHYEMWQFCSSSIYFNVLYRWRIDAAYTCFRRIMRSTCKALKISHIWMLSLTCWWKQCKKWGMECMRWRRSWPCWNQKLMRRAKLGKNYSFCASGCGFVHCVESTEVGVLMYVCDTSTCNNCSISLCVTDVWFCTWL